MIQNIVISVVMCLLLYAAAYPLIPADMHKKKYMILAFIGVLLRIATILYLYKDGINTFGTDGLLYHRVGIWIDRQLDAGVSLFGVRYAYTWYTVIVGLIYHIFGVNRYIASFINIALTFLSSVLLLKIALGYGYKFINASFISLAFLYFPNMILWTSDSRKEAMTIFICILCLYCVQCMLEKIESTGYRRSFNVADAQHYHIDKCTVSANEKTTFKSRISLYICDLTVHITNLKPYLVIALACILMWLCTLIRICMFVPMTAGILVILLLSYIKSRKRIYIVLALMVILSSFLIFFFTVIPLLDNYHAIMFPDEIGDFGVDIANKFKTVRLLASNRNILEAAANYFLLPYPGDTGIADISGSNILNMVVSIDMLCWYLCMLLIVPGILYSIRKKESGQLGILAFLVFYITINILVVENVSETIYRYRSIIIGLSLMFINWDVIARVKGYVNSVFKTDEHDPRTGFITNCSIKSNM